LTVASISDPSGGKQIEAGHFVIKRVYIWSYINLLSNDGLLEASDDDQLPSFYLLTGLEPVSIHASCSLAPAIYAD
jgi:hypothetical protein